ncbi:MAG: exosortase-associated EpsI family protein [Verrucomicrobiae bacterium]|nr:exosortase-associated EpsI family protein [Verrucomicrobiae bacterium]
MNRTSALLLGIPLALIAATYGLLARTRDRQILGEPAVRLTPVPLISADGRITRTNSVFLPQRIPGYEARPEVVSDLELAGLPPDTSFGRLIYRSLSDNFAAQATVVLMGRDRTSIHQPDFCLTGAGWMIQSKRYDTIPLPGADNRLLPVRRFDAVLKYNGPDRSAQRMAGVYIFWFAADGAVTASHTERTLSLIQNLVTEGVLQRWCYTSFFARCLPGEEEATYARLRELIAATVPQFQRFELADRR